MNAISMTVKAVTALSLLAIYLATTAYSAHAQDQSYRYDTVALSGQSLPGIGDAGLADVTELDLNNAGELIFGGRWWSNGQGESQKGLWLWRRGDLIPVAISGAPIPGGGGAVFDAPVISIANLSPAGDVAFMTRSIVDFAIDDSLFAGKPDNLNLLARTGDAAEGAGGLLFDLLDQDQFSYFIDSRGPAVNGAGNTAFMADLTQCLDCGLPGSVDQGLWSTTAGGGLQLFALTGELAPDAAGSAFARFLSYGFNDAGQLAFLALLDNAAALDNEGIWIGTPGALNLVARTGGVAPGTAGLLFTFFGAEEYFGPPMSGTGDVFFRAFVNSGDQTNDSGLWLFQNGAVELIARTGAPAPDTNGETFKFLLEQQINANDTVAFRGFLSNNFQNPDEGLWLGAPHSPNLLVRSGDDAPGEVGKTFSVFDSWLLNAGGALAFQARFDPAIWEPGIWAGDLDGISPVVRPGQALEVRPGEFRTVRIAQILGNVSREGSGFTAFNDTGQVMFNADFVDGTRGVFLATPFDPADDQPPVADAGPDQVVSSADTVLLDGTGSFDPEGGALSYQWRLEDAVIASGATASVGPFSAGTYRLVLTVTDQAGLEWSDNMMLTVLPQNTSPLAVAGPDQTADGGQLVALDGGASSDPEGGALTYGWTLDGIAAGSSAAVTVGPLSLGTHIATLTVTDPQGASATDSLTITVLNRAPVAQAGPDRTVNHAAIIDLDGTGSQDPDGDDLGYHWSLNGAPVGTAVTASAGPLEPGNYTIVLTVTDTQGASATDSLVVTVVNDPPVADAGSDRTIPSSATVLLDGSGSSDPEGENLTFAWSLGGQQIAGQATPTVGPFGPGIYTIVLTVDDGRGASATDSLALTVTNEPPVADAGLDLSVLGPQTARLDGSGSSDPAGDALAYSWSLDGTPVASGPQPTVGPFDQGSYVFTLTVTDPFGAAASDSVTLTVLNGPPVADAGPDQTIVTKRRRKRVTLDASASSDLDGTIVSYVWRLNGRVLGNRVSIRPRLRRGTNSVVLTVTDDDGASSSDEVVIIITRSAQLSGG